MHDGLSLLYTEEATENAVGKEALYRLSLDRIIPYFCSDVRESAAFTEAIYNLPRTADGGRYRQAILRDFLERSELLSELHAHLEKLSRYSAEYERERQEIYRMRRTGGQGQSFAGAASLVSVSALTLKRVLLLLGAMDDLLGSCSFASEGLRDLQADIRRIARGEDANALLALCSRFEQYTTVGQLDFRLALNASGRICACDLIPHNAIHAAFAAPKKKKLFSRKQTEAEPAGVILDGQSVELQEEMYIAAVVSLAGQFGEIARFLFDRYKHLTRELLFYKAAVKYCYRLRNSGVATCFPTVAADDVFSCEKAYDLLLLLTASPSAVVPYSVEINAARGTILFGDNSSGKTTFLRTVGVLQMLAQAGLPVPAERLTFSPCSRLLTYYAEAEKAEQGAGRFEQEVREFRAMFDALVPGTLVLLNEPFQSTAYDEGAKGLADILAYFSACGIRWILVSHMHQLQKHVRADAAFLHTTKGYGIERGI